VLSDGLSALQVEPDDSEILIIDDKSNPPAQNVVPNLMTQD